MRTLAKPPVLTYLHRHSDTSSYQDYVPWKLYQYEGLLTVLVD